MHVSVRLYVCLVAAAASFGVIADPRSLLTSLTGWHVLLVLALVVLCAVGEHVSFQVHSGWSTHAATVPHVATALLLPPGLAGLVAGVGMSVYVFTRRLTPSKAILNTASDMLSVEAAALAGAQLGAPAALVDPDGWRGLLAATVASSAYYAVSMSIVALVVALDQTRPLLGVLRGKVGVKTVTEVGLGLLGATLAVLLKAAPWFVPALGAPVLLVFFAKRALDREANRARDLALTSRVGRAVAGTLSLDLAFNAITAREVRDALRLDGVALLPLIQRGEFGARIAAHQDQPALRLGLAQRIAGESSRIHLYRPGEIPADWTEGLEGNRHLAAAAVPCAVGGAAPAGAL